MEITVEREQIKPPVESVTLKVTVQELRIIRKALWESEDEDTTPLWDHLRRIMVSEKIAA